MRDLTATDDRGDRHAPREEERVQEEQQEKHRPGFNKGKEPGAPNEPEAPKEPEVLKEATEQLQEGEGMQAAEQLLRLHLQVEQEQQPPMAAAGEQGPSCGVRRL